MNPQIKMSVLCYVCILTEESVFVSDFITYFRIVYTSLILMNILCIPYFYNGSVI